MSRTSCISKAYLYPVSFTWGHLPSRGLRVKRSWVGYDRPHDLVPYVESKVGEGEL